MCWGVRVGPAGLETARSVFLVVNQESFMKNEAHVKMKNPYVLLEIIFDKLVCYKHHEHSYN